MTAPDGAFAAIVALYGSYAHHYDSGEADEFAALFTRDGRSLVEGVERARGREALAGTVRRGATAFPGIRHSITSVHVSGEGSDGSVLGQAYVQAFVVDPDGIRLLTFGIYRDVFVVEDDRWRIQQHDYTSLHPLR